MTPRRFVALICIAEIVGMLTFASFLALVPTFIDEWRMSNTQAGWISGIYYAGYIAAVIVLVPMTDRVDPRRIYLASTVIAAASALAFGLFAEGFWSGLALRAVQGVGLAGTFLPGLRALTDRTEGPLQARAIAFYTASFGLGSGVSYFIAGEAAAWLGWRWAFILPAAGSAVSFALVQAILPPRPPAADRSARTPLLALGPVLRNRAAMAYVAAYACHCWELFAQRAWIVAFLVDSQGLQRPGAWTVSATSIAALISIIAVPASIAGNEVATRFGRRRVITVFALGSAALAVLLGFSPALPFAVVALLALAHGAAIAADSGALYAGVIGAADARHRGAMMTVQAVAGFTAGVISPLVVGLILDLAAGGAEGAAWGPAFIAMGASGVLAPLALALAVRRG